MALDKDRLGLAIEAFVDTLTDSQKQDLEYIWKGISECNIDELKNNGVVNITIDGTDYTGTIT